MNIINKAREIRELCLNNNIDFDSFLEKNFDMDYNEAIDKLMCEIREKDLSVLLDNKKED